MSLSTFQDSQRICLQDIKAILPAGVRIRDTLSSMNAGAEADQIRQELRDHICEVGLLLAGYFNCKWLIEFDRVKSESIGSVKRKEFSVDGLSRTSRQPRMRRTVGPVREAEWTSEKDLIDTMLMYFNNDVVAESRRLLKDIADLRAAIESLSSVPETAVTQSAELEKKLTFYRQQLQMVTDCDEFLKEDEYV
jgi:hypothetical protein